MKRLLMILLLLPLMSLAATYTYDGFVPTTKTKLWSEFSATDIVSATGYFCSEWVDSPCDETACNLKKDGTSITVQFQHLEGTCLKCVGVKFFTESDGVYAQAIYSRYVNGAEKRGIDFDTCSYYSNTPGASEGWDRGYCVKNLRVTVATTGVIGLAHRWSFNGNLTDSVGGQTATAVGSVTTDGKQYTLAGGGRGSSYINLGSNILPNDGSGVTLEVWGTQKSVKKCGRIWDIGGNTSTDMLMAWTCQSDINADGICIRQIGGDQLAKLSPYTLGTEFHVATVFKPQADGTWKVYYYKQDASTGATLASATLDSKGTTWSLMTQNQTDCWLGHSHWSDNNDANASYNEVRVWKRALTEAELTTNAVLGPDVLPGGSSDPETPIYAVTFDANGGAPTPEEIARRKGESYGTLPMVTRDGYAFEGWYMAASGGVQVFPTDVVTADVTLYAHWKIESGVLAQGLDAEGFAWATGGTKVYDEETVDWTLVSDEECVDGDCVQSGVVDGDGSITWLQTTVSEPGKISFKYKFQSYSGVFTVTCDDEELLKREGPTGSSVEWETAAVNVTEEGAHQILFSYQHGGASYGSGHNGVMLDDFGFTPSHCHVILKANNGTDDSKEILVKLNEPSALPKVMFSQFNSTFQGWAMSETGDVKYSDGAIVNFSDRTVVLFAQWRTYSYAEILDVSGCEFQSGGNGNWSLDTAVSKFGGHSVRSGSIGDRQLSWMRTSVTGSAVMTFWWKVSSEANHDFLKVLVDGDEVKSISGETDWQKVSLVIQPGTHTVEWQYAKDQATGAGSDCGWVDRVEFSTAYVVTFDGNGGTASVEGKAYAPGESYGELPACARSGSRFLGWFTQADGGTEIKSTDVVSSNVALYAHWEEIPCGLLMRYYDGVGNAYTQWTQSFDSLLSYFYARTPTLTEWSETNTDTLDFGGTSSGSKYHGKYATSSTDNFAMWMTGYIDLKSYGEYEFNVRSDDGFVLYVDGRLVATYTSDRGMDGSGTSGKIALTKGVHRIDLVHRDASGDHGLCLTLREPFGDGLVNIQQTDCPKGAAIRFEAGEGAMDGFERRYVEGRPIMDLPSPVREGYDFTGWFTREDGGVRVEESDAFKGQATLFAHWEVRADVEFDANGGVCETATHHYTKGEAYGWLPSCTRTGYDFVGWYTTSGGGMRVEVGSTVTGGGTLYAHWQKQLQDLTFDTAGGCAVGTISVPYGECVGNLPVPTKDGCVFDGWYDQAVGGSRLGPDAVITAGQKLYAHWKDADGDEVWLFDKKLDICSGARRTSETQQLTMSPEWEEDGVKAIVSVDGVPYQEATSAGECTWAGTRTKEYTLTHQVVDAGGAAVGEPYVAKFNWVNRVTVTFECQNGEAAITKTYDEASAYGELPNVTRTGYAFDGWYTAASGGTKVSETDIVPCAMTFYAHWINNRYSIRFHANGGEGQMENQSFSYDNAQDLSATAFARTGYTFAGWATSVDGEVVYGNGQSVKNLTAAANGSVDLYAVWNKNVYSVKFNANGGSGSMANQAMTYDAAKALAACAFMRTGYAFAGWATNAAKAVVFADCEVVSNLTTVADGEVNLYAQWTANVYSVKFDANGGSGTMADEPMTYDAEKTLAACAFTRTGYTFAGWATSAGGAVKYADGATVKNLTATAGGTVTLYAKWTPNNYVIDFNPGQGGTGTMSDQPMTYDIAKSLATCGFVRTGYHCIGWAVSPDGPVVYAQGASVNNLTAENGSNVSLYAVWAINHYTVKFNANGGTGTMADLPFTYGVEQKLLANAFTRVGWAFMGWATSAGGAVKYADEATVKNLTDADGGVVTLYAVWKNIGPAVFCDIREEYGAGENVGEIPVEVVNVDEPVKITVKGLPSGVKFKDGVITGAPKKSGVYAATVTVKPASRSSAMAPIVKALTFVVRNPGEHVVVADYDAAQGSVKGMGVYAPGKKVTLKATAAKGWVFSGWYDGDVLVSRLASYVLTMPNEDVRVTARFVTVAEDKESIGLEVMAGDTDIIQERTIVVKQGMYVEWPVAASALSATTVKVSGLPSGLKFTAKDMKIAGTPKSASKTDKYGNVTPSKVKITVTTAGKQKQEYVVNVTVRAIPAVGTFNGGGEDGIVTLTVAKTGKLSGKWLAGGKTWKLSASGFDTWDDDDRLTATLAAKCGKEVMEIALAYENGCVTSSLFKAYRNGWKEEPLKTLAKTLKGWKVTVGETDNIELTVGAAGAVKAKGTFDGLDGKPYSSTCSTVLIPTETANKYLVYVYFPPKAGKFGGFSNSYVVEKL